MSERSLKRTIIIAACSYVLLFVACGFAMRAEAEPFPEHLKTFPQAYECYTSKIKNGKKVKADTWLITWHMATEWFPELGDDNYIVFKGSRTTTIPTPEEYNCTVWIAPSKKPKTK